MKPEYVPPTPKDPNTHYILAIQSPEEQRLLTVLRDLAFREDKDVVIVIDGSEWANEPVAGMPERPVTRLSIHLEHRDGRPFIPKGTQQVDPTKPMKTVRTTNYVGAEETEKLRVQNHGERTVAQHRKP